MNKRIIIIPFCLFGFISMLWSQELSFKLGQTTSKLNNKTDISIYDHNINYLFISGSIDYLDHKFGMLSSELGFYQTGGLMEFYESDSQNFYFVDKFNCLSFSTIYKLKFEKNQWRFHLGVGPSFDFLIKPKDFNWNELKKTSDFKEIVLGSKFDVGVSYCYHDVLLGANLWYLMGITEHIKIQETTALYNRSLGFSLTIGYKL